MQKVHKCIYALLPINRFASNLQGHKAVKTLINYILKLVCRNSARNTKNSKNKSDVTTIKQNDRSPTEN